jgi:hypothetical protein
MVIRYVLEPLKIIGKILSTAEPNEQIVLGILILDCFKKYSSNGNSEIITSIPIFLIKLIFFNDVVRFEK